MCVKVQTALDAAHCMAGTLLGHRMKCSRISPELALNNLEYCTVPHQGAGWV